jgi:hypothetical protein
MQAPSRGRPRLEEAERRRHTISVRLRDDARAELEKAAAASGVKLSRQAEEVIEQSFDRGARLTSDLAAEFGPELAAILLLIGEAMKDTGTQCAFMSTRTVEGAANWVRDPFGFDEAARAANEVIESRRPKGKVALSKLAQNFKKELGGQSIGEAFARGIIRMADGHDESPRGKAIFNRVHALLGKRPEVSK